MSATKRIKPTAVINELFNDPHGFEFVQAVRILERWFSLKEHGEGINIIDERIRFRNNMNLSFPASQIQDLSVLMALDGGPEWNTTFNKNKFDTSLVHHLIANQTDKKNIAHVELTPAFMSLLGSSGTLPIIYTEILARHIAMRRDTSPREFLDIFLHRMVVLFYEAWRKYRPELFYQEINRQPLLAMALGFAGLGESALRNRLDAAKGGISDQTIGYFSGLMHQKPISAQAIGQILSSYFSVQVAVQQFIGRWFKINKESQTSLGVRNAFLGQGACSGERIWQRDLRVRLLFGPMSYVQYRRFLPGGKAAFALRKMLTQLTGILIEYEIKLCLYSEDVKPSRLGKKENGVQIGAYLGWDSFLLSKRSDCDRSDAGYIIHAHI